MPEAEPASAQSARVEPASVEPANAPSAGAQLASVKAAGVQPVSVQQAAHRLSAACTECHSFGGHERQAHNRIFERRADLKSTDCVMCHTEHKGREAKITKLNQAQCQSCHTQTIKGFANHPDFHPNFPYDHPQAIRFDHATHVGKHFADPRNAAQVPAGGCVGCHVVGQDARAIRPASFDAICANCHSEGIAKRDLVLFRWPEIETSTLAPDEVSKACGVPLEPQKSEPGAPAPAFSAVSAEPLNALAAYLLGLPADTAADYEKQVQDLARAMISDGTDPLIAAARERMDATQIDRLFSGLDATQARQAACSWAANQEYAPPGKTALPGWRADALQLRYTRPSHADPVLRAWIESLVTKADPSDADAKARLDAARKELLSASDGPGQCMKCHAVSGPPEGPQTINWNVQLRSAAAHTRFDHRPHLNLLGPEMTCTKCHQLDDGGASAAGAGAGLKPIVQAACTGCHAAGKVRDDCQTCHVYHQDHAFRKRMTQDAK